MPATEAAPTVLTLPEAARFLHVPLHSIRLLVRRGKVRHQRIGKRFVVPCVDLVGYLEHSWRREGETERATA